MEENQNPIDALENKFEERRGYWVSWTDSMTKCLKQVDKLVDLQTEIYTRRQEALENYHTLSNLLAKRVKIYKEQYAQAYNALRPLKTSPGATTFMYSTEGALKDQIEAQLSQDKYIIDLLESQMNYMDSTIKTIDGIIFAISNRIKLEEMKIGR